MYQLLMRSIINAREITIKQSKNTLLDKVSFSIKEFDKTVIVGRNGTGKTTLMTIIAGLNDIDEGDLIFANDITIGYLAQDFNLPTEITIFDLLQHEYAINNTGTWIENKDIMELTLSFQLPELSSIIKNLSGGQQRRVALLKALLLQPDILLLDEPTNHLDLEMIQKLEAIIQTYPKACIIISHDRYFVDNIATKIIEIDEKKLFTHRGGFKDYLHSRETRLTNLEKAENTKQDFLTRELEWVHAGVKARGTKNKGRMKIYQETKKLPVFKRKIDATLLIPTPSELGSKILQTKKLSIEINDKIIISDFSFKFEKGYRLGLIGPNGSGKTTFLNTLTQKILPTGGKVVIGENTLINYQDQKRSKLDLSKSILEEISGGAERTNFGESTINSYSYIKRFLFSSHQVRSSVNNLSGGEKARVLLAKQIKDNSNFLILDEPTNDLDIETLNVLEKSLSNYQGCMIIVSHDRYFLNAVCTHILSLDGDGKYQLSTGNYDDYIRKYKSKNIDIEVIQDQIQDVKSDKISKITNQENRKLKKEISRLEKQIENLEIQIKDKEEKFTNPDFFKNQNLENFVFSLTRDKKQLEQYQNRWLEISDILS
jgi:ABC transport system ATP-binding/permease protein